MEPKNEQIEKILSSMSLDEKIAQLYGAWLPGLMEDGKLSLELCEKILPHGVGHVSQFASCNTMLPEELKPIMDQLQDFIRSKTSAGVPALFHDETITGMAARGASFTPQMIGMSCSWNPTLVYENAWLTADNMRKLGCYYALSPMMDVITDARWGRAEEGYGEDAYLVASFILAFIQGLQGNGAAATAKHFAGYGVANQEPAFVRNETLYPFEVAVKKAGVRAIMPGYHSFHNEACSASRFLLSDVLRDEWHFDGVVVSDYGSIGGVCGTYHMVDTQEEAGIASLKAGVDVDFPTGGNFQLLKDAVEQGRLEEAWIDRAVRRVLLLKQRVGLLDGKPDETTKDVVDLDPPRYRAQCRKSAQQAVVLLKNNGILPLSDSFRKIAVIGPNADSYSSLAGDYTWIGLSEFFHHHKADREHPHVVTLLDGLKNRFGDQAEIRFERGFDWSNSLDSLEINTVGDERALNQKRGPMEEVPETNWKHALALAEDSNLIVVGVGENRFLCGENCNRDDIRLPGDQEKCVRALCETGKPVIMVVFGGRPMAISELAEKCAAVIYAWYPGEEGGNALADLMSGDVSPSGKLTVTLPENNEQVPVFYRQGERAWGNKFPFGFGLTYTTFGYEDLKVPAAVAAEDSYFDVEFTVRNTGCMEAAEVAQIYFVNPEGEKRLRGFVRAQLKPGEARHFCQRFYSDYLARYDADGRLFLKPEDFRVEVGASVADIRLSAQVTMTGDVREFDRKDHFFSVTMD